MAFQSRAQQTQAGIRFAVIREQARLRERQLELTLRVRSRVVIEQRQRASAVVAGHQQSRPPRARSDRHRGVRQLPVARERGGRVAGAGRNVGEIEERRVAGLSVVRSQPGEALSRLLEISGIVRQQCQAAVDLGGGRIRVAQSLQFRVRLFQAVELGENLRQLECTSRSTEGHGQARGGDSLRGVAVHHVRTREHTHGGEVLAIALECFLCIALCAL